jgi:ribonucleoside-diphosphate reductase beta chain
MSVIELKMKKKILDCSDDGVHQILPIKYNWAREYYKSGIANTWAPEEISMQLDSSQWRHKYELTEQERRIAYWSLGFFSTAESLTANNIVLAIFKHIQNAECRQYLLRQAFEEALHTDTFIYCCDSLSLDLNTIYLAYKDVATIKAKDEFVINLTKDILNPHFKIETVADIQAFIKNIIGFYVIMEGIFFYAGFAQMLYLRKLGKLVGIGQQFEYIMRDESIHLAFGCDIINTIKQEYQEAWTESFKEIIIDFIKKAVELESLYIYDSMDMQGEMKPHLFVQYIEYIADRRLERLGLETQYKVNNPLSWMSVSTDLAKEKNFFETKVTEYQAGGALEW